jgi:Putative Actinobacterial Holin-X, holin superfamily III
MPDQSSSELARAIQDVTEKTQLLVREEIALAKAEMREKGRKLAVGAGFGAVAGAFALFALIYLFEALAWAINDLLDVSTALWAGFLITGGLILVLGLILAFVAMRLIKKGSPPTPQMAIEEAQLIKGTLTASPAGHAVGPVGARQAPQPAPTEGKR